MAFCKVVWSKPHVFVWYHLNLKNNNKHISSSFDLQAASSVTPYSPPVCTLFKRVDFYSQPVQGRSCAMYCHPSWTPQSTAESPCQWDCVRWVSLLRRGGGGGSFCCCFLLFLCRGKDELLTLLAAAFLVADSGSPASSSGGGGGSSLMSIIPSQFS